MIVEYIKDQKEPKFSRLICLLLFVAVNVNAQFAAPVKDSLESAVLCEKRAIEIILPANYTTDTTRYDVWYVLDLKKFQRTLTEFRLLL